MSNLNARTKRRQMILVGGAMTAILVLACAGMFLFDNSPSYREKPKMVSITAPGTVDDKDAWRSQQAAREKSNETLIAEVKNQLKAQEEQNKKLVKAIEELKSNSELTKTAVNQMDVPVLDKPLPIGNDPNSHLLPPPTGKHSTIVLNQPLNEVGGAIRREVEMITFGTLDHVDRANRGGATEVLGFPTDEKAKQYGRTVGSQHEQQQAISFLPAGSFVRVAMLNGVDAPTGGQAQSNPLPVAFHVLDVAHLANKHQLDIRDCRIIAATWGDLSSERMMGRTETLACIINGQSIEMPIKGQVIGEDGKAGVRGRLVTKQGQLLAHSLFAGALSGIGSAFQSSATTTSTGGGGTTQMIDPNKISRAMIGGSVGGAGQQLAQYYLKAADKLYPVIETDGGRTVEILITQGAVYKGTALSKNHYQGLLKRNRKNVRRDKDD